VEDEFESEDTDSEEILNMQFKLLTDENILMCLNPVFLTDLLTGSYQFIVPRNYIPDESNLEERAFELLKPNTAIEYKFVLDAQECIYHLELNSRKLDEYNPSVPKFHAPLMNYTALDELNNNQVFFHP
jgi:hypothetical protein